ncbi:hypothetical protein ACRAVF_33805 (plasmid) [Bradyrhizobium oligotrophicum S58]
MTAIYDFPRDWYHFVTLSFPLRAASQVSPRPWAGGNTIYGPHAQLFMPKLTATEIADSSWRAVGAFFARLGGQAGLMRISDPSRLQPRYNMELIAAATGFSDGALFSDGAGFADGLLPPTVYAAADRAAGSTDVVLGGFPASTLAVLQRGDLLEIRPNGIPADFPHLYQVMVDGDADSSGMTGVEIRPRLRRGIASGDMVVLAYPSSVFHLVDDTQGDIEITVPVVANFGFALVEAIERV